MQNAGGKLRHSIENLTFFLQSGQGAGRWAEAGGGEQRSLEALHGRQRRRESGVFHEGTSIFSISDGKAGERGSED